MSIPSVSPANPAGKAATVSGWRAMSRARKASIAEAASSRAIPDRIHGWCGKDGSIARMRPFSAGPSEPPPAGRVEDKSPHPERPMLTRSTCAALALFAVGLPMGLAWSATPAEAAQSYLYREKRFKHACRPPLKFAAGACVRRCPAGYRDTGRYCRFRNMSR